MTDQAEQTTNGPGALAQHIAAVLKDRPGNVEVRMNPTIQAPIPANIASNLLEFLRRAQSSGMEAIAWVECYTYVQQFAPGTPTAQQPGVPFGGLPAK